jgi:predicted enzyme related to lactoylglutathione lyase
MQSDVMLFVKNVPESSAWYQELLGAKSAHGGEEFEMIVDDDKNLLFQLHRLEGDEHGINLSEDSSPRGAGVLVYVSVDDVQATFARATEMQAQVVDPPNYVALAGHTEFIVKDPDGYAIAVSTRGDHA